MPDAPVAAAPAAAPAAAAPSAPVAAPAPAAPVESAPAAVVTDVTNVPHGTSPEAPAADVAAAKPEPKQSDFEGDIVSFLEAHNAWERGEEVPKPGEELPKPAESEVKPAEEEVKPADEDKPWAPEEDKTITPEALNALAQKSPELQAAMDASPEVKNALFAMARTVARLDPIGKIFPNAESAQFAAEASGTFVNIRTGFLEAIDNPESLPGAYEQFANEFQVKDKDGKAVVDSQGLPVYDDDFQMLNDYIVDTYHDVEINDLQAAVDANQFANDEQRESADMALQALKYIKDWKAGKVGMSKPDLSSLDPNTRAYYEQKEREIEAREAALSGKEKNQTAAERTAAKQTYETDVARTIGGSVGKRLKALVEDDEKAGVFIPSYITSAKDPQTGISIFAKDLLDKFEEATYGRVDEATGKVIGGVAYIRNQAKMLARRPGSPDAKQARVDFVNRLIDEHLPTIYNQVKRDLQNKDIADRRKRSGNVQTREEMAAREPRGGGAPQPKAFDQASAMSEAYKFVDQNFPDLDPQERTYRALTKKNELMGGR
jgi:hypothetical protein